ncbi:MAG: GAF domain-containing protein [Candidatus Eisenbacteria bacterium]|uniref:histidine kinase n=1 Tax=Eiseniibacteriota bacterium TaxID=2212470 RepID=A0A538U5V8_UNCEI|nr:MAG: GAF domain-containing protein [Candidatus Eisenbacteria bacterium]
MDGVIERGNGDPEARGIEQLAQAMLALRSTADVGTACSIAAGCAGRALEASDYRLLRLDPRSGALRILDASGIETPYLAEEGGPIEWVLRHERAWFDEGATSLNHETLLWTEAPRSLVALPLFASGALLGCLLLGFPGTRAFSSRDRQLAQALADALALTLERAELHRLVDEERTRRTEMERRIHSDEESSASLMALVAHEIRTPLTAIKAYTETLIDTLANPHTPRERFLGIISEECDRLSRLVSDILDLSRLEAGQRPLRLARTDLSGLTRDVAESLEPIAGARQVEVAVDTEADLEAQADPDLLRRLFVNLISNAIKFAPVGGHVRVRASMQGEDWVAMVEDNGPGIPPQDLPRVFERFFRGHRDLEQQVEGTGLGLAIARGITELHGGRLWAESPPEGGSRFCLTMPLKQIASARARRIARQVVGRHDLRDLFDATVEMVAATMDAEIVSLMMVDPEHGDLFIVASRGLEGGKLGQRRIPVRSGVAGSVAAWGRPVLVDNIETDRRFRRLNHPQYSTKSLISVPLQVEGEVLGVVNVNNKTSRLTFDENDLALLASLVERIGSAVERAYAYPDVGRVVEEATEAIRSITRLKREGLLGGRSVVGMARAVARTLGMGPGDIDAVGYVAAIRDLGMAPLRDRLAHKGPLDDDERHALMQHPEAGVEMIRPLEYLGSARELILSHHERWDGTGYPRRLQGPEIPLGARILAVVDAWESMTSPRPYRPTRSGLEAMAELRREAGRQFDPEVVEAFAQLRGEERVAA